MALFFHSHCQLYCLWAGLLCQAPNSGMDEMNQTLSLPTGLVGEVISKQGMSA